MSFDEQLDVFKELINLIELPNLGLQPIKNFWDRKEEFATLKNRIGTTIKHRVDKMNRCLESNDPYIKDLKEAMFARQLKYRDNCKVQLNTSAILSSIRALSNRKRKFESETVYMPLKSVSGDSWWNSFLPDHIYSLDVQYITKISLQIKQGSAKCPLREAYKIALDSNDDRYIFKDDGSQMYQISVVNMKGHVLYSTFIRHDRYTYKDLNRIGFNEISLDNREFANISRVRNMIHTTCYGKLLLYWGNNKIIDSIGIPELTGPEGKVQNIQPLIFMKQSEKQSGPLTLHLDIAVRHYLKDYIQNNDIQDSRSNAIYIMRLFKLFIDTNFLNFNEFKKFDIDIYHNMFYRNTGFDIKEFNLNKK